MGTYNNNNALVSTAGNRAHGESGGHVVIVKKIYILKPKLSSWSHNCNNNNNNNKKRCYKFAVEKNEKIK